MQKPKPPDYISSNRLSSDHGIDAEQQLRLIYDGKLTGYRLTGKLQPFFPSMNPPYAGCKNPKPYPPEDLPPGHQGLPGRAKLTAEYQQIHATEVVALNKDMVTDLYYNKDEVVALKRAKLQAPRKSTVATSKKLTKVQQRVRDVIPEWLQYAKDRREQNPTFAMSKVITLIQKQSFGQHHSGTPFSPDTIRKVIKHLFPSAGTVGRPSNK